MSNAYHSVHNPHAVETTFSEPETGNLRPAVWRGKSGKLHRAVGAEVHRGIRLMWTACGRSDIPADSAWLQNPDDTVTCQDCKDATP
ncbi:MAG TPA: hypothetical protein ENH62_08915 [Marinobacter sp.]|uniref:Uncharacterized protein n=1 Tax=marine sediment metagenome TaxID=412755 RepID=A0A0F9LTD9_9ZZZZ|nr:hypothetical protein [Marinobacter sp.]